MNVGRQLVIWLVALSLLCTVGCSKKKPQLPSQAKAPAEPVSIPLPDEISEAVPPPPPPPEPKVETAQVEQPKPKPQPKKKKKSPQPPANPQSTVANPPANASNGNTTVAAAHPPANPAEPPADTAIAADVSNAQLTHQKQTTAQLLDETEKTLNGLNRTLSHDEEGIVVQIRSYVAQSRKATTDGDFERAYNLATKAHLLSDALVKK